MEENVRNERSVYNRKCKKRKLWLELEIYKRQRNGRKCRGNTLEQNEHINNLPNDCLIQIFSHLLIPDLLRVEKVCPRWRDISAKSWSGIKKLNLNKFKEDDDRYWEFLPRCGRYLQDFTFDLYNYDKNSAREKLLTQMTEHCKKLRKLTVTFLGCSEIKFQHFKKLFSQNKYLQCVRFLALSTVPVKMQKRLMEILPKELKKLDLRRNYSSGGGYRFLLSVEELLRFEDLNYLKLTDFTIRESELLAFQNFHKLTALKLDNNCIQKSDMNNITYLCNLKKLKLSLCKHIPEDFFSNLAGRCKNLNYLQLKECGQKTGDGLIPLTSLPNFENLFLDKCSGSVVNGIETLFNLKKFSCTSFGSRYNLYTKLIELLRIAIDLKFLNLFNTSVKVEILQISNEVTQQRIDKKMKLEIILSDDIVKEWNKKQIQSPLLVIKTSTEYEKIMTEKD